MRLLLIVAMVASTVACQRTPEQQQADKLRSDARERAALIENRAGSEADRLHQQASDLQNQATRTGGMTGERLSIRAKALDEESKVIRRQGEMQADAIKEDADARIKASKSR